MSDDNSTGELIYVQEGGQLQRKIRICHEGDATNYFTPTRKRKYNYEFGEFKDNLFCDDLCRKRFSSRTKSQVRPLFVMVLDFIVEHFDYVDSLKGFPSSMGEIIFKHILKKLNVKSCSDQTLSYIFQIFTEAYGSCFVSHLQSENALIEIKDHLDLYIIILPHLVELDLSSCLLGHDHSLLKHIGNSQNIKRLNLSNNYLSDASVRCLSLPSKMFQKGPVHLKELDLSSNKLITEKSLHHLKGFQELIYLNLSATRITNEKEVKTVLRMKLNSSAQMQRIKTEGWVEPLMKLLLQSNVNVEDLSNKSRFYGIKKLPFSCRLPSEKALIFTSDPNEEAQVKCAETVISSASSTIDADKELLNMYSSNITTAKTLPSCLWESQIK